jgi:hypothetical protein
MTQASEQIATQFANGSSNKRTWGDIIFNVKVYGAVGDGVTDDTIAIQRAFAAAKAARGTVYFPPGYFKITSTITVSGNGPCISGGGPGRSYLYTESNIPMITLDLSSEDMYYLTFRDIGFIGNVSGTRTSNVGILIKGDSDKYLNNCEFSSLIFLGTYCGIHSTRSTNIGGENRFDFNLITNLIVGNFGSLTNLYGIKFDYGSGTGSIFSNLRIGAIESCIEIGGTGNVNVGDLIFANIHFATAKNAIKLVASPSAYGSNQSIVACQFDAGVKTSLNFTNIDRFTVQGCNWGGGTKTEFTNCKNYRIDGMDSLESNYGVERDNIGALATTSVGKITLNADYNAAVFVEIVSFGLQQGFGSGISTTTFHVYTDTINATVVQIATNKSGPGQITHSYTITGNVVEFIATTNGTSGSNVIKTNLRIVGSMYDFDVTPD